MQYKIHASGYEDRRLLAPLEKIKKALSLQQLGFRDNSDTDYPVNRSWEYAFLIQGKNAELSIRIYPESESPNGYGRLMVAKYLLNVSPLDETQPSDIRGLEDKIGDIMDYLGERVSF